MSIAGHQHLCESQAHWARTNCSFYPGHNCLRDRKQLFCIMQYLKPVESHFPPITNTHSTLCSATTGTSFATALFNAIVLFGLSYHSLTPLLYNTRWALLNGESLAFRVMKILLTGSSMLSLAFGEHTDTHKYTDKQTNPEPKALGRTRSFPDHHQSGTKSKKLQNIPRSNVFISYCSIWECSAMYNIWVVFLTSEWTKILDQSFLWESLILVGWVRPTGV